VHPLEREQSYKERETAEQQSLEILLQTCPPMTRKLLSGEILKQEDAADKDQRGHATVKDCQSREYWESN